MACLSSDLSPGRRTGLAHRVDLIRSLSASWRDPSQICHPVTPPRPVPTSAQTLEGDIRPHDHAGRDGRRRHRDRHPPRYPRGRDRRCGWQADRGDADRQRQRRVRPAAGRDRRGGARAPGGGLHRGQPQLRDRAGAGAGRRRAAGARVRAAQPQAAPREGQVRPHRRAPGGAGRAAPGRGPAAGAARGRRPGGPADLAGRPAGDHRGLHRAGRAAACPAAGRRRHRPPGRPHDPVRPGPGRARRP